jgi:aerobic-type carbon monoxide dehydrogenase small subunit (CoxS/CutS family)
MSKEPLSESSEKQEETKNPKPRKGISRRQFIAGTVGGVVVGAVAGAAAGSLGFPKTITQTETATQTQTKTATATQVQTQTATATQTATQTVATTATTTVAPPGPALTTLNVNGKNYNLQIDPNWTLQRALQFKLGLTGAKTMCDRGQCGSCTVIIDNRAVLSCTTLAAECVGRSIQTVEGIAADPKWAPLIHSYMKWECSQCGYCTPGFVVTAKALLAKNPNPTVDQIKKALSGNICRCGTYLNHPPAITEAAAAIRGGS